MCLPNIGSRNSISALVLLAITACPVSAHQLKSALTDVRFNPRSCMVEIVHRFHLHDVEHAAEHILGRSVDLISDVEAQSELARRVSEDFALGTERLKASSLRYIGEEVEGKFLWVYQEWMPPPQVPTQLWFRHSALQSVWPAHENQVNLGVGSAVQSLAFRDGESWKSLPSSALRLPDQCDSAATTQLAPAAAPDDSSSTRHE